MKAVGATFRGRGVLPVSSAAERGRVRQRSFSALSNGSPPARPHRDTPVSAVTESTSRRHPSASLERPRSVEWRLLSTKASRPSASSAQQQSVFMDDDELERRLNGPDAIAMAASASSSTRRPPRAATNGAASRRKPFKTNGSSELTTNDVSQSPATYMSNEESVSSLSGRGMNNCLGNGEHVAPEDNLNGEYGQNSHGINGTATRLATSPSWANGAMPKMTTQIDKEGDVVGRFSIGGGDTTSYSARSAESSDSLSCASQSSTRSDSRYIEDLLGESTTKKSHAAPMTNGMTAAIASTNEIDDFDDFLKGLEGTSDDDSLVTVKSAAPGKSETGRSAADDFDSFLSHVEDLYPDEPQTPRRPHGQMTRADDPFANLDQFVSSGFEGSDTGVDELSGKTRSELAQMQYEREQRSQAEACEKYCKMLHDMISYGKVTNLKPVQRIMLTWYRPLMSRIEAEQAAVWQQVPDKDKAMVAKRGTFGGRNVYGPLLVLLKADKLAVLVMHEVVNLCLSEGNKGVPTLQACKQVAELVQQEVNDLRMRNKLGSKGIKMLNLNGRRHIRQVNKKAAAALESLEYADWPLAARIKLGAALIKYLLETASWSEDGRPAFLHEVRSSKVKRRHGVVAMDSAVYSKIIEEDVSSFVEPRFVPMLTPPENWTRTDRGGYRSLRTQVMRTWGNKGQKESLKQANLERIYDGLNCLGKVSWRINTPILDIATEAWEKDLEIGDLPKRAHVPMPEVPEGLKLMPNGIVKVARKEDYDNAEMRSLATTFRRSVRKVKTKNANLHSMRCDLKLKMDIAEEFRNHSFYFPYNMDFRGRTYPLPPNLNILGSDFCRGVLMFDEARPLTERGLYWMKVHLANLYGEDKIGFDDRVTFVEDRLDEIRDSALNPLDGKGWWIGADKPWQCLGVCRELTVALDSPDPAQHLSRLPVHQDGSCNGLQHYAALGLDEKGGSQVNLVPSDRPQDVYTGVCEIVKQKIAAEAEVVPPPGASEDDLKRHRIAKMVNGKIDRKVVKQTVMTSVYGVTFIGARKQIQNQIEEKLNTGEVMTEEDEANAYSAASYVAKHTMTVLEELFTEARSIMEWLMEVAVLVAKEGQPVTWVTPLGLPVMQPYRRPAGFQVQTLLQGVHLMEENEHLPVAITRQKSAFPPNFVHSLDSTHMLLTAMEMDKAGVPFAAVHDSYWVHAGNVDGMNAKLRQCFVNLYSGPILEKLYESLMLRYPTIDFPPIPARGTLKLDDVKNSKYFFN